MTSSNEIKVGDKIRVTATLGSDRSHGVRVGDVLAVHSVCRQTGTQPDVIATPPDTEGRWQFSTRLFYASQYVKVEDPKRLTKDEVRVGMRVIGHGDYHGRSIEGRTGTVLVACDAHCTVVLVDFGSDFNGHDGNSRLRTPNPTSTCWNVPADKLSRAPEVATPIAPSAPARLAFKVGDEVVGVGPLAGVGFPSRRIEGIKGTIKEVDKYDPSLPYRVMFGASSDTYWVRADQIKAAPETPSVPVQEDFRGFIVVLFEGGELKPARVPFVHMNSTAAREEALRLTKVHKKQFVVLTYGGTTKVIEREVTQKVTEAAFV